MTNIITLALILITSNGSKQMEVPVMIQQPITSCEFAHDWAKTHMDNLNVGATTLNSFNDFKLQYKLKSVSCFPKEDT